MRDTWRAIRASVAGIVISVGLLTSWLAMPQSVVACSCVTNSLVEFAKLPDVVVFTGTVGKADQVGVPVVVDTWFLGSDIAPVVHLDPSDIGAQSSMCGVPAPPPGTRYVFASGRVVRHGLIVLNLCTPHGDVSTPGGQALLVEAERAFPNPRVLARPAPTRTEIDPLSTIGGVVPFIALGMSALVAAGLVVLVTAMARRRRAPD